MIYITGDMHIPIDAEKLLPQNFPEGDMLDDNDYVIICGDFGGVWENGYKKSEWMEFLGSRKYKTLFIDGNHENFDLLNAMPVEKFCGGKVHMVSENVIHLMRGQVYTINGAKFFTFGGAFSRDKERRTEHISWWRDEMPNEEDYREGFRNLEKAGYMVDYVITHTAPLSIISKFYFPANESELNRYLSEVDRRLSYGRWYFGHVHEDKNIGDKYTALYNSIIELGRAL